MSLQLSSNVEDNNINHKDLGDNSDIDVSDTKQEEEEQQQHHNQLDVIVDAAPHLPLVSKPNVIEVTSSAHSDDNNNNEIQDTNCHQHDEDGMTTNLGDINVVVYNDKNNNKYLMQSIDSNSFDDVISSHENHVNNNMMESLETTTIIPSKSVEIDTSVTPRGILSESMMERMGFEILPDEDDDDDDDERDHDDDQDSDAEIEEVVEEDLDDCFFVDRDEYCESRVRARFLITGRI